VGRVASSPPTSCRQASAPIVVLDDDPTGTQLLADVWVLLRWSLGEISRLLRDAGVVHILTNTRALEGVAARRVVTDTAALAREAALSVDLILRGDSTLRAHFVEEYEGARASLFGDVPPVHLLVPALPSAGRVTIDGEHLIQLGDGRAVPLAETEYARDGAFSYSSSNLLAWADERSHGLFGAADGAGFPLRSLRSDGGTGELAELLCELTARGRPCVCAPDAVDMVDVERIAEAYALARERGACVLARSAPAFAGVLSQKVASALVEAQQTSRGVVIICGSYVPTTTRQLAVLRHSRDDVRFIEVDVRALAESHESETRRIAADASIVVRRGGIVVVATPSARVPENASVETGSRIAHALADVIRRIEPKPGLLITKGGITSAVVIRDGLGADEAFVVGPILPGVSLWRLRENPACVVVPGNVGDDSLLAELVAKVAEPRQPVL
jgi:uncharacterized protein YgbK (DUF1537 family)